MNDNNYIYQAMFLLDNSQVREQGFNASRDWVKTTLEKHGATVKVLRLWGERALEYPIQGRARATYLIGYIEGTAKTVSDAKHEMYLLGPVFRSLFLQEQSIPEDELKLGIEAIRDEDVEVLDDAIVAEPLFAEEEESEEAPAEGAEGEEAAAETTEGGEAAEGEAKPEAKTESGEGPEKATAEN